MKRITLAFVALIVFLTPVNIPASEDVIVMVDGEFVEFDQPPVIVDGRTLIPIRAVCEKIGATVEWDDNTRTASVSKDGITLSLTIGSQVMYLNDGSNVYLDVAPQIYGGRTLLPLRAVIEKLGGEVKWDENERTVIIEYQGIISIPGLENTQPGNISNWARVSSVQQFAYKDEGLAYAYTKNGSLQITTPTRQLSLEMKYPKLGDVISDEDGYFYIVWGKDGTSNTENTVFISKYSPDGGFIKSAGFTGSSIMGANGNTKIPFNHGNCVSVINDGVLIVNYARTMYNNHQSNNVIGVNTADMSAYKFETLAWDSERADLPYVSHSFNQSVIFSEKAQDFIFANHGDAYERGFIVDKLLKEMYVEWQGNSGTYVAKYPSHNIFHFYLEANANYDMYIVNKTFAQLGGLAETSKGVALVGASAKSIGESAKDEKQNLFIQIFNPLAENISPSMFVGGTSRSGATSFDINDSSDSPLTRVTDYGVHWLTGYTDRDAIAPQVVAAGERLVILWSTNEDTFYMVLSASGDVIINETSLEGRPLNSFEQPVYHNGTVYWAAVKDGKLRIMDLEIR